MMTWRSEGFYWVKQTCENCDIEWHWDLSCSCLRSQISQSSCAKQLLSHSTSTKSVNSWSKGNRYARNTILPDCRANTAIIWNEMKREYASKNRMKKLQSRYWRVILNTYTHRALERCQSWRRSRRSLLFKCFTKRLKRWLDTVTLPPPHDHANAIAAAYLLHDHTIGVFHFCPEPNKLNLWLHRATGPQGIPSCTFGVCSRNWC